MKCPEFWAPDELWRRKVDEKVESTQMVMSHRGLKHTEGGNRKK